MKSDRCIKKYLSILMVISLTGFINNCTNQTRADYSYPERLKTIPKSAIWFGGVHGGFWIRCRENNLKISCTIYDDVTGDVIYSGPFKLEKGSIKLSDLQKSENFDYFSLDTLSLKNETIILKTENDEE
jgi:hypothetical protein